MSKEKTEENKKIIYMRDELNMSFREIAAAVTLGGRPLSESKVARIYRREKDKQAKSQN